MVKMLSYVLYVNYTSITPPKSKGLRRHKTILKDKKLDLAVEINEERPNK